MIILILYILNKKRPRSLYLVVHTETLSEDKQMMFEQVFYQNCYAGRRLVKVLSQKLGYKESTIRVSLNLFF